MAAPDISQADFEMSPEDRKREREEGVKLLDTHVNALAEHFENVQIFCSKVVEGGEHTFGLQRGAGNVYARIGQAREWIVEQDEMDRDGVREKPGL